MKRPYFPAGKRQDSFRMSLSVNNLIKALPVLFVNIMLTDVGMANGFSLGDQDAFATARGGAFVATADNPSAIYYNPAGIAQLEGDNLRGSLYGIYLDQTYQPVPDNGNTYRNSDHLAAVPSGFYAHRFRDSPFSAGLGIYAPYGGSIEWPSSAFPTIATQGRLTYLSINPAVALELGPHFSLGAGLSANYSDLKMEQWLEPFPQPPTDFRFTGDGWSVGYSFGALWHPIRQLSFGASFRSSSPVTLKGHTGVEVAGQQPVSVPAQMQLTFPLNTVAGVSWRPTPKWNLEFDAAYTAWSSFGATAISQQGTVPFGVNQVVPVTLNWQDSWTYEAGVTRYFDRGWHASAGYTFDENSVPDAYYTPLAADLDRSFFSLGAGFSGKLISFDVTYQFGYGPGHTVTGSQPSAAPDKFPPGGSADGKYGFFSNALMVTAGIRF